MLSRTLILFFMAGLYACNTSSAQLFDHSDTRDYMGTVFTITAIANDNATAKAAVDAAFDEVVRIEKLISSWDSDSETSMINENAGIQPVSVSRELYDLIYRSKMVSELTDGIFDISFASIDKIWQFDGSMTELPSEASIAHSVSKIDYEHVQLNAEDTSVFLEEEGMKIGFGAIGKGYAANRCKAVMKSLGAKSGIVNAGGDLTCWGNQKNGQPWTIGIVNPVMKHSALSWLEISNTAVVTSGNYERFAEFDGKRYCHIINPVTGWPAEMLTSVTIICPDAELADALATAVFIMGADDGITFINQLKDIEC
ncbi:MAG: FAD:protein FMN transferase, partial [Bacteroidetes bacterium]|nr:FAD:protein FMN transferase [Bacteroidota bacterium]